MIDDSQLEKLRFRINKERQNNVVDVRAAQKKVQLNIATREIVLAHNILGSPEEMLWKRETTEEGQAE
uniref:Uncharacterized protein n=1 Tax=Syphacia muris TaxID=451379 RepID=A0A0N5AHL3_9BILA